MKLLPIVIVLFLFLSPQFVASSEMSCLNATFRHPMRTPLKICKQFSSYSCCTYDDSVQLEAEWNSRVAEQISNMSLPPLAERAVQPCLDALSQFLCIACDGNNKKYYQDGRIRICDSMCRGVYTTCRLVSSIVWPDIGDEVQFCKQAISLILPDMDIEVAGEELRCYSGNTATTIQKVHTLSLLFTFFICLLL